MTYLSDQVVCFPAFVVPFPGFVDFVLETLTFSTEGDKGQFLSPILKAIGAKIFITEETEIIGNDERARTELYLYKLCRARRRKAKPKTEKAMYSVSNSISGIIMIIMIISFRDKTNTDYSDETDTYKERG